MIIEIVDDGRGAWNFVAKAKADVWPPMYMAYGRTVPQIDFLLKGILDDLSAAKKGDEIARTPDVDHIRGAAEALEHVAERIANAADDFDTDALKTLRIILEATAADLGIDEDREDTP